MVIAHALTLDKVFNVYFMEWKHSEIKCLGNLVLKKKFNLRKNFIPLVEGGITRHTLNIREKKIWKEEVEEWQIGQSIVHLGSDITF